MWCNYDENLKLILGISKSGRDLDLLVELVGITRAACPVLLRNLQDAVASANFGRIARVAHLIKAAADNISAERTYDAADRLEMMARRGVLEGVQEAFLDLSQELDLLDPALTAFADSLATSNALVSR